jgi:hypothetical protein
MEVQLVDRRRISRLEEQLDPGKRRKWLTVCAEPISGPPSNSILDETQWNNLFAGRYPLHPEGPDNAPRFVQQARWLNTFGEMTAEQLEAHIRAKLAGEQHG